MRLVSLRAEGFRSLNCLDITLEPLTILIGENDAGKSSVLELIAVCLSSTTPDPGDYYQPPAGSPVDTIQVTLGMALEPAEEAAQAYAQHGILEIRKTFFRDKGLVAFQYFGRKPADPRLLVDFPALSAETQRKLISDVDPGADLSQLTNSDKRSAWFSGFLDKAPTIEDWLPIPPKWPVSLPRFEHYSAMDYSSPENMIAKTVRQVFEQSVYQETTTEDRIGARSLVKPLQDLQQQATRAINEKVAQLLTHIQKFNASVASVEYEPAFDFTTSIKTGEFRVNCGRGPHALSKTGDGTKRRMFMGVLEWDREVTLAQAAATSALPTVVRGYDEPDTNLHFEAQRVMFKAIEDIATARGSRIQAVVCTHSLALVDRAAAQSIRLLRLDNDGCTSAEALSTDGDPDIEFFLTNRA